MVEIRRHFHEDLERLEGRVQEMGAAAREHFVNAMKALIGGRTEDCDAVIAYDDVIDDFYLEVEKGILDLFALQTPVASDLRLLTVLLHVNMHLERIGDMAVNIAKITKLTGGLPRDDRVVSHLEEMGAIAERMLGAAMLALANRDDELCRQLPSMDEPIDRLNRGMMDQILAMARDVGPGEGPLEWGLRMQVVSRQVERVGDHAVDIGEQVAFLVTGEFREFTDASSEL